MKTLRFIILLFLAFVFSCDRMVYAQTGMQNSKLVSQFPGGDVGTKVTNAQNACNPDYQCLVVIDSILGVWASGTLPALCANCMTIDYRGPGVNFNPAPSPSFPLKAPDGSVSAPSYSWKNETNSGLYRVGTNDEALSVNGVKTQEWTASSVKVTPATNTGTNGSSLLVSQTVNNGFGAFELIKGNLTETSALPSWLLRLQTNGTDEFQVFDDGSLRFNGQMTSSNSHFNFNNGQLYGVSFIQGAGGNCYFTVSRCITNDWLNGAIYSGLNVPTITTFIGNAPMQSGTGATIGLEISNDTSHGSYQAGSYSLLISKNDDETQFSYGIDTLGQTVQGAASNGSTRTSGSVTSLVTTNALTVTFPQNLFPANSVPDAVACRIVTTMTGTGQTQFTFKDNSAAANIWSLDGSGAANTVFTAGNTFILTPSSPVSYSLGAATLQISISAATATGGTMRCTSWYHITAPPTS